MDSVNTIVEPSRELPVWADVDVCVVGGSCTGLFAAVRAARLGASVVLIERSNCFGGVATNALVLVWHSLLDTEFKKPIIGGLTKHVLDRLAARRAAEPVGNESVGYRMNTEELKIELDMLVKEHPNITPMLHTFGCRPLVEDGRITAMLVENKDGRGAIRARVYIDATGDGDVAARAGVPYTVRENLQPPTPCAKILHFRQEGVRFGEIYRDHAAEFGLPPDSGWDSPIPQLPNIFMAAQTHVFNVNAADAKDLTYAEMEGRRTIRAVVDMMRKYTPQGEKVALVQLPSVIGIRETRIVAAEHCLKEEELLHGVRFDDAIANGSYRIDVHAPEGGGFLFKYLDGRQVFAHNQRYQEGRWREPTPTNPTFYQVPYRCLYHRSVKNLLTAGRMINSDRGAFGAVRVMVNMNQTGEAAGTAAALAARADADVTRVDSVVLRKTLADGGSIIY